MPYFKRVLVSSDTWGRSKGCITVTNTARFERFAAFLRQKGADLTVPGTNLKAYGTVEVK
ncbi:hypothetical protein GPA09_31570 [Burkholderia pseudomallei]|nr:hypothetical protein [Burkholderia pseudomallei]